MTVTDLDIIDTAPAPMLNPAESADDIRTAVAQLPDLYYQLRGQLGAAGWPATGVNCTAFTRIRLGLLGWHDLSDRLEAPDPDDLDLTAPFAEKLAGYLASPRRARDMLPNPVLWVPGDASASAAHAPNPVWRYLRADAGYRSTRPVRANHVARNRARGWSRLRDNAAPDALDYWRKYTDALNADLSVFATDLAALGPTVQTPTPPSTNRRGNKW